MRKVIDLCLDMPMGAEALTNMLSAMCLDPLYRGYKKTYGAGVAAQVGLTVEEIDAIYESEGRDGFLRIIREAAEKHAVKPAEFVRHLDEVGVEWGITCDGDHDNRKTAEIVQALFNRIPHKAQCSRQEKLSALQQGVRVGNSGPYLFQPESFQGGAV